jgi:hypothetical protein
LDLLSHRGVVRTLPRRCSPDIGAITQIGPVGVAGTT